jgi:hypothetical protein
MNTMTGHGMQSLGVVAACALGVVACGSGDAEPVAPAQEMPRAAAGRYVEYPEKIASFGAAVLDDGLYVYSGHIGETHSHSIDNLSKSFRRLDLAAEGAAWQTLSFRDPVQSASLVAHGGSLYRIGGMTAANGIDDVEEELFSTVNFERYDPDGDAWQELPALPGARSSHDAVVVGDTIYVFGGWELSGGDSASGAFFDKGLKIDLSAAEPAWVEVDQPFKRRAVCAAAVGETIYVIGGLTEAAEGSLQMDVYDAATGKWSAGPDVPTTEDSWNAFGCTAFGVGGAVVFSGRDGVLSRLGPAGWGTIGTMTTSRFFHRMLPDAAAELLLVGGATIEGDHLSDIEVFEP